MELTEKGYIFRFTNSFKAFGQQPPLGNIPCTAEGQHRRWLAVSSYNPSSTLVLKNKK